MKKILVIPSWYPSPNNPLLGSFFREQAKFLNQSGSFDICILYGEEKSTSLLKLVWIFTLSFLKKKWPIQKKLVLQDPIAYGFIIPKNRRFSDKFLISLANRLYQKAFNSLVFKNFTPDLIHAQSGMDAGIYAHSIARFSQIPFVILEHQVFVFHYYSRFRAKLVLQAFEEANKTAAVSKDERRQILMNQPNCNPEVIFNLVNEDKYRICLNKRNKIFTIITILNSLPIKGFDTFLESISELAKVTNEFKFIMIGKGADEHSNDLSSNIFVKKSKELGIYDYGSFFPFVKRDHISDILNCAHVFVAPTIQEPHGIAIREAMMCGLPVISTANGGAEDSVNDIVGLVVPVKNPKAMTNAIIQIKENYSQYSAEEIRSIAELQTGKKSFLKNMISFYQIN